MYPSVSYPPFPELKLFIAEVCSRNSIESSRTYFRKLLQARPSLVLAINYGAANDRFGDLVRDFPERFLFVTPYTRTEELVRRYLPYVFDADGRRPVT